MLNINYYVEKQYFIVQLEGKLVKKNCGRFYREVVVLIKKLKICNLIFETNLDKIDMVGLKMIVKCYRLTNNCLE